MKVEVYFFVGTIQQSNQLCAKCNEPSAVHVIFAFLKLIFSAKVVPNFFVKSVQLNYTA